MRARTGRRLTAALAALFLALWGPAAQAAEAPRSAEPALWRIADEDTTIWLFGTIHILPEAVDWRTPAVERAIGESDELMLEAVLAENPAGSLALLTELGVSPGLPPVGDRVAEEQRAQLAAMIARSPFPQPYLDALESWAAAFVLIGVTLNELGLDPSNGVENALEAEFEAAGKPIGGFETEAQQLGFFDALPEGAQRDFLATVIDTPDAAREAFDAMLDAWASGDEDAIAATFDDEVRFSDMLREVLLTRRNARWADAIAERLDRPGTVFVGVGAGHLAGEGSVQDHLAERGVEAERIQ